MISLTGANTSIKVAGTGRRGRCDRAVELPVRGDDQQAWAGAGQRQHVVLKPAPTLRSSDWAGSAHPEKTDSPPVRPSSPHRITSWARNRRCRRRSTSSRSPGRLGRKRIMEKGAATMERLFLELGGKSAPLSGGRRLRVGLRDRHRPVYARGAGLREPDPDAVAAVSLRGGCGDSEGHLRERHLRRPAGPRHPVWAGDFAATVRPGNGLWREASRKVRPRWSAGRVRDRFRQGIPSGNAFTDVDNKMTIAQEEIFGPCCRSSRSTTKKTRSGSPTTAHRSAGNVMSGSLERSLSVAPIKAGFMGVNGGAPYGAEHRSADTKTVGWPAERCGRFRRVHRDQIRGVTAGPRNCAIQLAAGDPCPVTEAALAQRAAAARWRRYAAGLACGHLIGTADAATSSSRCTSVRR